MYSLEDRKSLVVALLAIDDMRVQSWRNLVVHEVEHELRTQRISAARRAEAHAERDAADIITACCAIVGGLQTLCTAIEMRLGSSAPEVKAFVSLCAKLRPLARLGHTHYSDLDDLVGGMPAPADLEDLLRFAVGDGRLPGGSARVDLVAAIQHLRELVSQEPLFRLVEALAATTDDPGSAHKLHAWSDETAPLVGLTSEWLARCRAALAARRPSERGYVMISLVPDAADVEAFHVMAWICVAGHYDQITSDIQAPIRQPALAAATGDLVADRMPGAAQPPIVEFFLPCDRLNIPVDQWHIRGDDGKGIEIGVAYPVVVRALDRDDHSGPAGLRLLRERATRLAKCTSYDPDAICWHDGEAAIGGGEWVCLALTSPRMATGAAPIREVLASGAPVAVWHRDARPASERQAALSSVLTARGVAALPDTIRSQRRSARHPAARNDHPGRDVVLFWDDPDRTPPQWYPLSAPEGPSV